MSGAKGEQESTETLSFRCDCERCRLMRGRIDRQTDKVAFTLAEVLITLGIIGIVAALTLPTLTESISERINSERQANVAFKITQAVEKMHALGLMSGKYTTTDAFVDELQKHLKIAKRCDANHIAACWPTDKVTTSDGEEFEIAKAKKGKNLGLKNNTSDNVGLVLADGASIILTYNQNSEGIDVGDKVTALYKDLPMGFGKTKTFAYTTSVTAPIDFVMDVNGAKGPNSETIDNKMKDIRSFKVARFSRCDAKISGIGCVVSLGTSYSPNRYGNYWKGAIQACLDIGMILPDSSTLGTILDERQSYPELPQSVFFLSSTLPSGHYYPPVGPLYHVVHDNDNYHAILDGDSYTPKNVICIGK